MKNLSTWLLVMFMIMFWVFRIIVAFTAQYGKDFGGFIAFNFTEEVILLFVAILSFIFAYFLHHAQFYALSFVDFPFIANGFITFLCD